MDGDPMKWFRVYHDLVDDPKVQRLPGDTFKFWINILCLASRSPERGLVNMDVDELAFSLRLEDDEVAAMLADLVKRGLLHENDDVLEVHNWRGRQYDSDSSAERVRKHRERKKRDGNVTPNVPPSVSESVSASDSESLSALEARFNRFWEHYPRKEAKEPCRKWWMREKPDDALTEMMIAAVVAQGRAKKWTKDRKQYIPMPSTWLNQKRWEDDIDGVPAIRILPKPASQMTELDRLRQEYDAYQADTYRNYGPVRVRELNALLRQIQELEAKEQVS